MKVFFMIVKEEWKGSTTTFLLNLNTLQQTKSHSTIVLVSSIKLKTRKKKNLGGFFEIEYIAIDKQQKSFSLNYKTTPWKRQGRKKTWGGGEFPILATA